MENLENENEYTKDETPYPQSEPAYYRENTEPLVASENDRLISALTHGLALIPMTGLVGAVVITALNKDKSRFVYCNGVHAIAWQVSVIITAIVMQLIGVLLVALTVLFAFMLGRFAFIGIPIGQFLFMGLFGIGYLFFVGMGLYGGYRAYQGEVFRYPVIGTFIEDKFLSR